MLCETHTRALMDFWIHFLLFFPPHSLNCNCDLPVIICTIFCAKTHKLGGCQLSGGSVAEVFSQACSPDDAKQKQGFIISEIPISLFNKPAPTPANNVSAAWPVLMLTAVRAHFRR